MKGFSQEWCRWVEQFTQGKMFESKRGSVVGKVKHFHLGSSSLNKLSTI
jgi:hypothetical protein